MAFAPILQVLAASGVLGGRFLSARRENAAYRDAVGALLDPSGAAAGYGLTDAQQQATRVLAANGQGEAAFDFAVAQAQQNQRNRASADALDMDRAKLHQQRASHNIRIRELEQDVLEFNYGVQTDQRTREEALAAAYDPALAAQRAATSGRDTFQYIDQSGTARSVPMANTDRYNATVSAFDQLLQTDETYRQLVDLVQQEGLMLDPDERTFQRARSLATQILFLEKNRLGGGALDQGLIDTMQQLVANPTDGLGNLLRDRDAVLASIKTARGGVRRAIDGAAPLLRGFQGLDPELVRRTRAAMAVDPLTNEQVISEDLRERNSPATRLDRYINDSMRQIRMGGQIVSEFGDAIWPF